MPGRENGSGLRPKCLPQDRGSRRPDGDWGGNSTSGLRPNRNRRRRQHVQVRRRARTRLPQAENPEGPVEGEHDHGDSQDEQEGPFQGGRPSSKPAPESTDGRGQSSSRVADSTDGRAGPLRPPMSLLGLASGIPYGHDSPEQPVGDVVPSVARFEGTGTGSPGAQRGTPVDAPSRGWP